MPVQRTIGQVEQELIRKRADLHEAIIKAKRSPDSEELQGEISDMMTQLETLDSVYEFLQGRMGTIVV